MQQHVLPAFAPRISYIVIRTAPASLIKNGEVPLKTIRNAIRSSNEAVQLCHVVHIIDLPPANIDAITCCKWVTCSTQTIRANVLQYKAAQVLTQNQRRSSCTKGAGLPPGHWVLVSQTSGWGPGGGVGPGFGDGVGGVGGGLGPVLTG